MHAKLLADTAVHDKVTIKYSVRYGFKEAMPSKIDDA
jgi:hypothetical protein